MADRGMAARRVADRGVADRGMGARRVADRGMAARRVAGPLVGRASSIPGAAELPVAGAGGELYPEAFRQAIGPAYPDAATLCRIVADSSTSGSRAPGQLLAPEPLYLRRPDAREPGPPKRVTPPNHPAGS
jgi:hypothetical protein